jgi:glyoxylase-like metal-dependent hydrolase (beta-lactamase superfamily II)
MIVTHGHFDHVMGAWQVQKFFNIPFYIHPKDQFLLDRILETAIHFLGNVPAIAPEKVSYLKIPNILILLISLFK